MIIILVIILQPKLDRTGWLELTNEERDARRMEWRAKRKEIRANWYEILENRVSSTNMSMIL